MKSTTQDILDELYQLSPELKNQEDAIVRIIEKMQKHTPHIQMDEGFRARLKSRILSELKNAEKSTQKSSNIWFSKGWFLWFASAFSIGFAGFLIAIPLLWLFQKNTVPPPQKEVFGGAYRAETVQAPMAMVATKSMSSDQSSSESLPYYEYIYTGSLDLVPKELKSYQQMYPSDEAKIGDYLLVEPYGAPLDQRYFDPNRLQEISLRRYTDMELQSLIRKGGDERNAPTEWQKTIQVPISEPTLVYIRETLFSPDGIDVWQQYVPALLFRQRSHQGAPTEIVVPLFETSKR